MPRFTPPSSPSVKENKASRFGGFEIATLNSPLRAVKPLGENNKWAGKSPVPIATKVGSQNNDITGGLKVAGITVSPIAKQNISAAHECRSARKFSSARMPSQSPRKKLRSTLGPVKDEHIGINVPKGSLLEFQRSRTPDEFDTVPCTEDKHTPPPQPTCSPEFIVKGGRGVEASSIQGYGAGLVMAPAGVGLVKDRRKCKPIGVLTVEIESTSSQINTSPSESVQVPPRAAASVLWVGCDASPGENVGSFEFLCCVSNCGHCCGNDLRSPIPELKTDENRNGIPEEQGWFPGANRELHPRAEEAYIATNYKWTHSAQEANLVHRRAAATVEKITSPVLEAIPLTPITVIQPGSWDSSLDIFFSPHESRMLIDAKTTVVTALEEEFHFASPQHSRCSVGSNTPDEPTLYIGKERSAVATVHRLQIPGNVENCYLGGEFSSLGNQDVEYASPVLQAQAISPAITAYAKPDRGECASVGTYIPLLAGASKE